MWIEHLFLFCPLNASLLLLEQYTPHFGNCSSSPPCGSDASITKSSFSNRGKQMTQAVYLWINLSNATLIHPEDGHVIPESHPTSCPAIEKLCRGSFLSPGLPISLVSVHLVFLPTHQCGGDLSSIGDIEAITQGISELRQKEEDKERIPVALGPQL